MKAKLGIPPRWNRAPLLFDGALPKFNALVGRHPPGAERRGPPAECMRPDYGFDDAQAEVRAPPALSGRLEAGSTSNLWFHGSQGMRVEIELPQGPDLSAISDIAMFHCGLSETVLRLPLVRTHGRNPRVRLPQAPSPLCILGRARSDTLG